MKIKMFLTLFIFGTLVLCSCNKNSDDDMTIPDAEGDVFTCYIDGKFYNSDNVSGTNVGFMQIAATLGSAVETFQLILLSTNVGTYNITAGPGSQASIVYYPSATNTSNAPPYAGVSGTLKIEEHSPSEKRIKGTFSFVGENVDDQNLTISFTDGHFEVKYN